MGRRPKLTPHQRQEAIKRRDRDEETLADIGRSYNVSPATISRLQLMDGFEFNPDVDENDAKARLAFAPRRTQDASAGAWTPTRSNRVVRKYAGALGLERCYSAHSMRATFITTALENGAQLEDVQKAAGHRDPSTTKLYDRRGYNPEKAASFFATY